MTLTKRQTEVLQLVARGNTNKQIARVLGISGRTVLNHFCTIRLSLDAPNMANAACVALSHGMIAI